VEYTGPTNKVLPVNIQFPPKHPETTRLAAWNVSGLVAFTQLSGIQELCSS